MRLGAPGTPRSPGPRAGRDLAATAKQPGAPAMPEANAGPQPTTIRMAPRLSRQAAPVERLASALAFVAATFARFRGGAVTQATASARPAGSRARARGCPSRIAGPLHAAPTSPPLAQAHAATVPPASVAIHPGRTPAARPRLRCIRPRPLARRGPRPGNRLRPLTRRPRPICPSTRRLPPRHCLRPRAARHPGGSPAPFLHPPTKYDRPKVTSGLTTVLLVIGTSS